MMGAGLPLLLSCCVGGAVAWAPSPIPRRRSGALAAAQASPEVTVEEAEFVRRCGYYAFGAYDEREVAGATMRTGAQPWPREGAAARGFVDDEATGTHAAVWSTDEAVVVAFRGTDPSSWRDLRTDFDARQRRVGDALVHAGFDRAWTSVRAEVSRIVDDAVAGRARSDVDVVLTGLANKTTIVHGSGK